MDNGKPRWRLSAYSDRVVELETGYAALKAEHTDLKKAKVSLEEKLDDLENRSRRANLRVIGIPEKMEGSDPVEFMTKFFLVLFGTDFFPVPLVLSRAYRLGRVNEAGGNNVRPRGFIVLFHNYQDKECIFAKRREDINFRGHKISLFPDFSVELSRKCSAFNEVKTRLYKKGVRFGLIYPARLRVDFKGKTHYFDSPDEAQGFYNSQWHD